MLRGRSCFCCPATLRGCSFFAILPPGEDALIFVGSRASQLQTQLASQNHLSLLIIRSSYAKPPSQPLRDKSSNLLKRCRVVYLRSRKCNHFDAFYLQGSSPSNIFTMERPRVKLFSVIFNIQPGRAPKQIGAAKVGIKRLCLRAKRYLRVQFGARQTKPAPDGRKRQKQCRFSLHGRGCTVQQILRRQMSRTIPGRLKVRQILLYFCSIGQLRALLQQTIFPHQRIRAAQFSSNQRQPPRSHLAGHLCIA